MPLCRCWLLYQATKWATQRRAASASEKGRRGYTGVCFRVRNSASEYGLSSETCGRLKDGMTPSHCSVEIIVLPRMGVPLSECSTRPRGSISPSEHVCVISAATIAGLRFSTPTLEGPSRDAEYATSRSETNA